MSLRYCHLWCRSEQLSSADKAAVRRMVTSAFQRVVATGGQSLGEVNTMGSFFCTCIRGRVPRSLLCIGHDCHLKACPSSLTVAPWNKLTRPQLHDEVKYEVFLRVRLDNNAAAGSACCVFCLRSLSWSGYLWLCWHFYVKLFLLGRVNRVGFRRMYWL